MRSCLPYKLALKYGRIVGTNTKSHCKCDLRYRFLVKLIIFSTVYVQLILVSNWRIIFTQNCEGIHTLFINEFKIFLVLFSLHIELRLHCIYIFIRIYFCICEIAQVLYQSQCQRVTYPLYMIRKKTYTSVTYQWKLIFFFL